MCFRSSIATSRTTAAPLKEHRGPTAQVPKHTTVDVHFARVVPVFRGVPRQWIKTARLTIGSTADPTLWVTFLATRVCACAVVGIPKAARYRARRLEARSRARPRRLRRNRRPICHSASPHLRQIPARLIAGLETACRTGQACQITRTAVPMSIKSRESRQQIHAPSVECARNRALKHRLQLQQTHQLRRLPQHHPQRRHQQIPLYRQQLDRRQRLHWHHLNCQLTFRARLLQQRVRLHVHLHCRL